MQKARFSEQQLPVKVIQKDGTAYVYICLNETQGTESYPDMGEGQTTENYYEYDYNEIIGPAGKLPMADIQAHPENYLDYEYAEDTGNPGEKALKEIEENEKSVTDIQLALAEIYEMITGGE